jgi:hypothetical protein
LELTSESESLCRLSRSMSASRQKRKSSSALPSSAFPSILLQKSKVAPACIFGETSKCESVDDSYSLSRVAEIAYEFCVRR